MALLLNNLRDARRDIQFFSRSRSAISAWNTPPMYLNMKGSGYEKPPPPLSAWLICSSPDGPLAMKVARPQLLAKSTATTAKNGGDDIIELQGIGWMASSSLCKSAKGMMN